MLKYVFIVDAGPVSLTCMCAWRCVRDTLPPCERDEGAQKAASMNGRVAAINEIAHIIQSSLVFADFGHFPAICLLHTYIGIKPIAYIGTDRTQFLFLQNRHNLEKLMISYGPALQNRAQYPNTARRHTKIALVRHESMSADAAFRGIQIKARCVATIVKRYDGPAVHTDNRAYSFAHACTHARARAH